MNDKTDTYDASPCGGVFDAELLLRQARNYLAFGEQVHQFIAQLNQITRESTDWGSAVQQHFAKFKDAMAQSTEDPDINPELARLWTQTAEIWQQSAASLGGITTILENSPQNETWQAYQHVQSEYFSLLQSTARQALDLMQQRIDQQAASNKKIDSLRKLYNLWVECNEETYSQMLHSSDYAALNGRLLNALLACYSSGKTR